MTKYIAIICAAICLQGNHLYAKNNEPSKTEIENAEAVIDAQGSGKTSVTVNTSEGRIEIMLYDETPVHRDNFVKNAEAGVYDGTLFHRVIMNFMIQGGDPASRESMATAVYGAESLENSVKAEIDGRLFHHSGAVAAARAPDGVNPEKASSDTQFFIVRGKAESDASLTEMEQRLGKTIPEERKTVYKTIGGAPYLDGEYTIFGRVTKGMDVVDLISRAKTDGNDRPFADIYIKKVTVKTKK